MLVLLRCVFWFSAVFSSTDGACDSFCSSLNTTVIFPSWRQAWRLKVDQQTCVHGRIFQKDVWRTDSCLSSNDYKIKKHFWACKGHWPNTANMWNNEVSFSSTSDCFPEIHQKQRTTQQVSLPYHDACVCTSLSVAFRSYSSKVFPKVQSHLD